MKRAAAAVAVALLVLAAPAAAKTTKTKLAGTFPGDENARISFTVKISKRHPDLNAISKVKVSNLDYRCQDDSTGERSFALKGSTPIVASTGVATYDFSVESSEGGSIEVSGGLFGKKARRAAGYAGFTFEKDDGSLCSPGYTDVVDLGNFTAKAKKKKK